MSHVDILWNDVLFSLLCSAGYIFSAHYLCRHCFTCNRKREKILIPLLFATLSVLDILSLADIFSFPIERLLCQALIILWIVMTFQGEVAPKVSAAVIVVTGIMLTLNFIVYLLMCLELILLHTICGDPAPLIFPGSECVIILIGFSCVILSIRSLSKHISPLFEDHTEKWYTMLTIPLLCIMMLWNVYEISASRGILFRGTDDQNLYVNQLCSYIGICVLAVLCMCGAGFYLFGMTKIDVEQKKKERYHSHVMFYQMLSEQYAAQERLRHDMKNHIIVLLQLIDRHEWDQLESYLYKMAESGGLEHTEDVTGNHVIDALLYNKHKKALHDHIRWECDVRIPPNCPIDDFDLCVIFGNIIDNALEACEEIPCGEADKKPDRFIRIHCQPIRKFLLIEVLNTACKVRKTKSMRCLLSTPAFDSLFTKTDMRSDRSLPADGIGLMNVRETVNKYNGTLAIDAQEYTYHISILLPVICAKQ